MSSGSSARAHRNSYKTLTASGTQPVLTQVLESTASADPTLARFFDINPFTDIAMMNADGSGLQRLTTYGGEYPVWSPGGTRIAFGSARDGNYEIYIMNADGTNQIRLTDHPAYDMSPGWSPDGKHIIFD